MVLVAFLLGLWTAPAATQTIDATTYPFTFGGGVALEDLSSGAAQLLGPDLDNAVSGVTPIGFEFWFAGTRYTSFSVNSNGLLKLSSVAAQSAPTNNLASILTAPQIAPYWDDLWIGTNGSVRSKLVGTAPTRKLVVEWQNLQVPRLGAGFTGAGTFQAWLYETTGKIEFVYDGGMATNTTQGGYSVGVGSPAGTFASVTAVYPSVAYGTANNANVVAIASGTRYAFTPQLPAAPTSLAFSQVGALAMTLGWVDNAANEVGYAVWRSTDGVTYDFVTQTAANATSSIQSGLNPGTTYFWIVRAVTEGGVSDPLTGSQATSSTGNIATAGSGNWSSTAPGAPWPGGIVPTSSDNVTISDGHTVTVDATANCYGLTVGQGTSGALRFESASARTLTVVAGATVTPGAILASAASGTQTGHVLSIGGSLTNQGTLDFSTNGNLAGAALAFTGGSDASLSGAGPVTNVRALTVNKASATLALSAASFTVRGQTADTLGFLTLTSGTFRLAGSATFSSRVFTTDGYTLPSGTTLWLDNPNCTVLPRAGSATVRGLRVSAGLFQAGLFGDNSLQLATGSQVTVEGGEVRIAGRFAVSSQSNTVSYLQSGGTVTVNTVGNSSASLASFDLGTGSTSSATFSGGVIVIQNASTAASGPRDYRNGVGTQTVTGGTLQLGSSSTGAPRTYVISGTTPSLLVSNLSGGHTARLSGPTTVEGSTQIASGATLDLNGFRFTQSSGSLVNDGILTASASNSELYFLDGGTPQTYSGAGSIPSPVAILSVDNPAGVSIAPGLAANVVTRRVNLIRGVLGNSQKVTIGNADGVTAVTQVGAAGLSSTAGSYDTYPVFNPGVGGIAVSYLQEGAPRTTGFEIPATRQLRELTVDNPGGVVIVSGGPVTCTKGLTLTTGLLRTTGTNLVTLSDTASAIPAGTAQSYLDGPLAIAITTDTLTSRAFAVGRDGAFRPLVLGGVVTGGLPQVFTAEVVTGSTGGTPTAPLQVLTGTRYVKIGNSAGLNAGARVQLAFGTDDDVGALANLRVAQSGALDGSYADLGGTATGTQSSGAVVSTTDLTPGSDYFVVASTGVLASTWDGGAGTSNWSDDANWSPDGVPGSGTNVTLSLSVPATLHVAGTQAVHDLTVNSNATIVVDSGALTVNGAYEQTGGAVHLAGGALAVSGTTSVSGGTLDVGPGTFTAADDVSVSGGSVSLSSGTFLADSSFDISGGTVSLGTGTLELKSAFARSAGNFYAGTGTTIFSGTTTQDIGGGLTYYDLVLRNGGAGNPKRFQALLSQTINNDLIVESTAQMGLSAAIATQLTVWGNFHYSGLAGGPSIGFLTVNLSGIGKSLSGVETMAALALRTAKARPSTPAEPPTVEVNFLTDPARAARLPEERDGKPLIVLENTFQKRKAQVEQLLQTTDPAKRLVINLDDVTLVRNPVTALTTESAATATLPMPVTVSGSAAYALDGNLSMATSQTLTILGRLDCGTFTMGGAGKVSVGTLGTLGTATDSPTGLAATVLTTGSNSYSDGAIIEYNRAGDQTIHAGNHPAAALIRTAGSGTKTLSANKTITGSSGGLLTQGALFVGSGTTFADGGNRLSFTTAQIANVIVQGTYLSTGTGSISFESGAFNSNILPASGTAFGDLLMNFTSSTQTIDLNANGTANLSFRNLTCGGTAGTGTTGGTLRLGETGTTNVTITGNVSIAPATTSNTGGGFGGTSGKTSQATLLGNLSSTSVATTQPILNNTGTNKLVFAGAARETLSLAASTTLFTGSTLQLANPAGMILTGSNRTYTIGAGGTVDLGSGNLATGTNTLALAAGSTLTRTAGRVVGSLKKAIATGPATATLEIGTETIDTPVSLTFGNVTTAGSITASTTSSEHPNIGTSNLDATKSVNRYYTLTNTGTVFDSCKVGLTFGATDVDAGANPGAFAVRKFNSPTWSPAVVSSQTATHIDAKRITSFSDFAIAEGTSFYLSASAGWGGSISPSGTLIVSPGASQAFTISPNSGYYIVDVVVDGFSVGPVTTYTFSDVTADHAIAATFNTPPVLSGVPATASIPETAPYTFTATATDGDVPAQTLTFSLVGAPAGAAIGASSGVFTWTPTEAQGGASYPFTVRVSDGLVNTDAAITLTVNKTNTAPVLSGVPATAGIPETAPYAFAAAATDSDIPVQTLAFSLVGAPAGATIGSSSGVFTWTPTESQGPGSYPFTVRVSDGVANTDAGITLTVNEVNAAPVLSGVPSTATILETAPYGFTATATDGDLPAQTLTFSLIGAPTGAAIDGSSGAFTWTPSASQGGTSYPFTVRVSDAVANTDAAITLTVSDAFTIMASAGAHGSISPSGAVLVAQGASPAFTVTPDSGYAVLDVLADGVSAGQVTSYTFSNVTSDHTISATFAPSQTVTAGPPPTAISTAHPCVTVPVNISRISPLAIRGFSVTFTLSPNLVLCSGLASVTEGTFLSSAGTTSFFVTDKGAGTYTVDGVVLGDACGPTALTGNLFNIGVASSAPSDSGTITLADVKLRDCSNHALFVATGATPTVRIDNTPPSVSVTFPNGAGYMTIASTAVITWTTTDNAGAGTVDLAYSTDSGASFPNLIASAVPDTGSYPWTVPNTPSTTARVRVTAHDVNGNVASDASDADFEIREANVPPVLTAIGNKNVNEGALLSFTASATDANVPAQTLAFSLDGGAPAGASIDPSTGAFTWTPTEAQGPGDYPVTVRVTDNGSPPLDDSETISIHVDEVNAAPVLSGVPASASIPELVAYGFTASASDSDLPAQ
ncbi:MAG TPA: putative Ig domain-containing protein, partial [Candidatus Eisenbacteria bacterium]